MHIYRFAYNFSKIKNKTKDVKYRKSMKFYRNFLEIIACILTLYIDIGYLNQGAN